MIPFTEEQKEQIKNGYYYVSISEKTTEYKRLSLSYFLNLSKAFNKASLAAMQIGIRTIKLEKMSLYKD